MSTLAQTILLNVIKDFGRRSAPLPPVSRKGAIQIFAMIQYFFIWAVKDKR
jgi:hypothetical protein